MSGARQFVDVVPGRSAAGAYEWLAARDQGLLGRIRWTTLYLSGPKTRSPSSGDGLPELSSPLGRIGLATGTRGGMAYMLASMSDGGAAASIVLRPGVPGLGLEALEDGTAGFPSTSDDLVKLLREQGVVAEFDRPLTERSEVTHQAADVWLPVLEIIRDLGIGVLGGCIVELVAEPTSRVHAKVGRNRKGKTEWLEISGQRDEVIEAIGDFLESGQDGDE